MLPPSVEESITAIAEDRTSGASKVARLALETMMLLVMEEKGRPTPGDLAEAARRVSEAQPAMSMVHNVAYMFEGLAREGMDPREIRSQLAAELDTARERVAQAFLKVVDEPSAFVTLSHSENVLAALKLLDERGRVERVYVMEGRPLFEGRTLAKALAAAAIDVILVPDAAGPGLLAGAKVALVGADSVLRDGSLVNKVGTYPLALSAREHGRPFYVACESLKFDTRYDATSWPGVADREPTEAWPDAPVGVTVANRTFEITPPHLVTRVVTERGGYAPDIVKTLLADARFRRAGL